MSEHLDNTTTFTVLFVDDEPLILKALERALSLEETTWEALFANSAQQGMEILSSMPVDAVVSDLRMPSLSGAEFLANVKETYPGVIRMVLSGEPDKESLIPLAQVTHQSFAKPCDSHQLVTRIEKLRKAHGRIYNSRIKEGIGGIASVSSLEGNLRDLQSLFSQGTSSIDEIAKIVQRDPGLTTKILQIVHSPYFNGVSHCRDIKHAVSMLGPETIRLLAEAEGVFESCLYGDLLDEVFSEIQVNSIVTACIARTITYNDTNDEFLASLAYTAGLLHDFGKRVLFDVVPDLYLEAFLSAKADEVPQHKKEYELLSCSAADVAGYLLCLWGFPDTIVDSVINQHEPPLGNKSENIICTSLHVASSLVTHFQYEEALPSWGIHPSVVEFLTQQKKLNKWVQVAAQAQLHP